MPLTPRDIAPSAQGDPAFLAGLYLRYPPPDWWRVVRLPVPPPTRAHYWTQFSLDRLTREAPLPRRTRNRAANRQRALAARRWRRDLAAYQASAIFDDREQARWRIQLQGTLEYYPSSGPETVAEQSQSSPWQPIVTVPPTNDEVRDLYYQLCRASIRGLTGLHDGKDSRHGPDWTATEAPVTSTILTPLSDRGVTYDNSNLYPLLVTLLLEYPVRGRRSRKRAEPWQLYPNLDEVPEIDYDLDDVAP